MNDFLIVGNVSDDPFALDMGSLCRQAEDISDLISLKTFANSEFCPRFIVQGDKPSRIGKSMEGKTVVICSTANHQTQTRNALAMRTFIIAAAAKENGAKKVILVEPDLFFSAQDRGPNKRSKDDKRARKDLKKFNGQAFTAELYANLLKTAGVDMVVTVHNHSAAVQSYFSKTFNNEFFNLLPQEVYADYLKRSDMIVTGKEGDNLILCAPDKGAVPFTNEVFKALDLPKVKIIFMTKERSGERSVKLKIDPSSDCTIDEIEGKDVIIMDDMVRTGNTVIECCNILQQAKPNKVCFGVTHFYSSREARSTLNSKALNEILTLNTIPSILNRDLQGRLRRKMTVLKIEKWIAKFLLQSIGTETNQLDKDFYTVDMSSKNPRWRPSAIF